MKIIIEHKGVQRQIEGTGFNVCGSATDMLAIADQIKAKAESLQFAYGWIQVRDPMPDEHCAGPDTQPKAWNE
jgi:hypothetical protein